MTSDVSQHFDEAYYEGNDQSGDRVALWFYARLISRLVPSGSRVFEYGSGKGHLSKRIARRFSSFAYDLSDYARGETSRTSPRTKIVSDLGDIQDASFDAICSLHVLEHVPDPSVTLRDFARWIRPSGRLFYVVPNPDGWGHRLRGEEWFGYRDETHCSLLGRADWLQRTEDAGFTVEQVRADGLWDPPYVRRVPRALQLGSFGAGAAAQVAVGRAFLPADWGECIIVTARRGPDAGGAR